MNHQGPAYQLGQVVGTAIGFVTMFANPCTMGAAAGGSLRALNGIQAGQSLYDAGQKAQAGDYAGAAWDVADAAMSMMDVFGKCFVPGTPILTPGGSKAIEQFREGDLVLSRDEHDADGEVEVRVVEHVFARTSQVWELKVGGRSIGTTAEHPFWVEGRGWTIAARLVEGDRLGTLDGESVVLEGISSGDELVTVYNMRIGDYHTYFVGDPTWGFSVWAHNAEYLKGQQGQAPNGIAPHLEPHAQGVKAAGKYDATVGSLDEARQVIGKAMPDAVELPPAVAGQPYASPPPGVKKWFQVQPAEPNVGNMQPHIKYADWTQGKKGKGGSWGHIFFPE